MKTYLLGITLIFSSLSATVQAETFEKTLDNGLKVIVKQDHRAPVIVQQVWYKAGSMDELTGETGVAHVLEHLMFKGTEQVPAGEFSKRIAAAGGRENAFTSYDYTAYFQQLHKSQLELAMQLESDRMHNLNLKAKDFAKEIQVVMEERRLRTEDSAHATLQEQMMSVIYQQHPYQNPVIGWMSDLENMSVADAQAWYQRWYAPNNAILVIAGDVQAPQVFALAEKYYGVIPKQELAIRRKHSEPEQRGIKRMVVKAPAELPHLVMSYHAPAVRDIDNDWKPYALQVLAGILDGNDSARLNKSLVKQQQIASSVGAGYDLSSRGPSLFTLEATPSQNKTVADMEQALRSQINQLIEQGVTASELERVKTQVMASEVYKLDSLFYQAMQIGQMESIGLGHPAIPAMLEKLQTVTAKQVQQVAKEVFQDDQLTVATLDPQPLSDQPTKRAMSQGAAHAH